MGQAVFNVSAFSDQTLASRGGTRGQQDGDDAEEHVGHSDRDVPLCHSNAANSVPPLGLIISSQLKFSD
jgi:hypothetical protein